MTDFTKAFIRTSTRYAEYVEAKILERIKPQELEQGEIYNLELPEFEEELRKEMQTMIKTAELLVAARSQIEQKNTPKTGEGLIRYSVGYSKDTNVLEIVPVFGGSIQLYGEEDVKNFLSTIRDSFEENMSKNMEEKNGEERRSVPWVQRM